MYILFYNEHQDHELICSYITRRLFVLNGLCIFNVHFNAYYVKTKPYDFIIFCVCNVLSLIDIGYIYGGTI